jgi:hypothetical protein
VLDPAFGYLIIAGIALLFASAGAHKLRDLARFADAFAAYRVLPDALARRLAWLIPSLELGVAAGLLSGPSRRTAVIAAIIVLIAYASGLGVNLLLGRRDLDCGCGTARDRRAIAAWMVWRNLILAAAVGITLLPWSPRSFDLTDLLTVVGGLTVGVTLYAAVDRLLGDVAPKAVTLRSTS